VIQGQATVDNGADIWHLKASSIDQCDMLIEAGEWHRIKSTGIEPLIIIETWLGTDLREDDIERKEDRYGRV
jgi:mannose-6-phosphate isomerase-like protein (cupin superfamily)